MITFTYFQLAAFFFSISIFIQLTKEHSVKNLGYCLFCQELGVILTYIHCWVYYFGELNFISKVHTLFLLLFVLYIMYEVFNIQIKTVKNTGIKVKYSIVIKRKS